MFFHFFEFDRLTIWAYCAVYEGAGYFGVFGFGFAFFGFAGREGEGFAAFIALPHLQRPLSFL